MLWYAGCTSTFRVQREFVSEAAMFKKLLLGLTFITAFTFVSAGVTEDAQAWRRWYGGRPYVTYYSAPRSYYYGGYTPYRSFYRGPIYGAPVYYRQPYPYYYDDYYYGGPAYYYGPRSGVSVSFGF
jgi:hypothetical protein